MNFIRFFHQFKILRQIAKSAGKRILIKQKFHSGYIFLNAVEHSWAWTGKLTYNTFDVELQSFIHNATKDFEYFIDIGSNIGVMTIGTLLKNKNIRAVSVDPNAEAVKLLKKSLVFNKLSDRCEIIEAVISDQDGSVRFDPDGSVTGHVTDSGESVKAIRLSSLLNKYSQHKTFVKIDIEGYETTVLKELGKTQNLTNFTFILEVHPLGFNECGDPAYVFGVLEQLNADITALTGNKTVHIDPNEVTQLIINFK